jgi:tetratricopeptide (TPR) repeat protein
VTTRRLAAYENELTLWSEAATLQPLSVTAQVNIGNLLARAGRRDEAIERLEHALVLCPESMRAHYDLARALEECGRTQEAIDHYREAIRVESHPINRWQRFDEGVAAAHTNLGRLLAAEGKHKQAIVQFREALGWQPDHAAAHNNLGIALANVGQIAEAIEHFEQALRLNRSIEGCTNLATAYAAAGRSEDAMQMAAEAIKLARAQGETALADQIESHLQDYRAEAAEP